MKDLIKLIYSMLIAVALTVFAAITISVAYAGPSYPELSEPFYDDPTEQQIKEMDEKNRQYEKDLKAHDQRTTMILVGISITIFLVALAVSRTVKIDEVISDGMLFGGLFINLYAAFRGYYNYYSERDWMSVLTAFVALVMIIVIAQLKFGIKKPKIKK